LSRRENSSLSFAEVDPIEPEKAIRSTGFYRNTARSIIVCHKKLVEKFGEQVPRTMEELIALPASVIVSATKH
jgi:endonuclease III